MSVQGGWANDPVRAAGGRRRYNATRRLNADMRRHAMRLLVIEQGCGLLPRGTQAALARALDVSEATISRDLRGILKAGPSRSCPLCGARALDEDGETDIALGLRRIGRQLGWQVDEDEDEDEDRG